MSIHDGTTRIATLVLGKSSSKLRLKLGAGPHRLTALCEGSKSLLPSQWRELIVKVTAPRKPAR